MKKNCWEFMGCGREPGGKRTKESGVCMVPLMTMYDGLNGGSGGGRACWMIAGTVCGDSVQGTFAHKMEVCPQCNFYRTVKKEEGAALEIPLQVLRDITRRVHPKTAAKTVPAEK